MLIHVYENQGKVLMVTNSYNLSVMKSATPPASVLASPATATNLSARLFDVCNEWASKGMGAVFTVGGMEV